jgi:hypothetical protein
VAAAAISRYASTLDGLLRGYLREPDFEAIVERDLADGQHRNPGDVPGWFTTAYFHLPDELLSEAADAGLHDVRVVAVEGPAWLLPDLDRWLSDDREVLLRTSRRVESTPPLLGVSAHLLPPDERSPRQTAGRAPTSGTHEGLARQEGARI